MDHRVRAIQIADFDNVAVVVDIAAAGASVIYGAGSTVRATEDVPLGHKIALLDIGCGQAIIKYGEVIGRASQPITAGAHVHVNNVMSTRVGKR
jgi:altronate dehydratase